MPIEEFNKYFANCRVELQRAIGNDIPKIVANKGLLLFKKNFQTESFFGQKWKDVKRRTNPRKSQMGKASAQRPILTGTGDLGRSLKYEVGQGFVRFYSDLPYSAAHNEGITHIRAKPPMNGGINSPAFHQGFAFAKLRLFFEPTK